MGNYALVVDHDGGREQGGEHRSDRRILMNEVEARRSQPLQDRCTLQSSILPAKHNTARNLQIRYESEFWEAAQLVAYVA